MSSSPSTSTQQVLWHISFQPLLKYIVIIYRVIICRYHCHCESEAGKQWWGGGGSPPISLSVEIIQMLLSLSVEIIEILINIRWYLIQFYGFHIYHLHIDYHVAIKMINVKTVELYQVPPNINQNFNDLYR